MDARPDLLAPFATFGVPALVSPKGESAVPIAVTVIVHPPDDARLRVDESRPAYERLETGEELKSVSFSKTEVGGLPTGSGLVISDGADAGAYTTERLTYEDGEIFTVRIAQVAG